MPALVGNHDATSRIEPEHGPSVNFRRNSLQVYYDCLVYRGGTNDFVSEYTRSQVTAVINANVAECNVSERSYKHRGGDNFLQFGYEGMATFL